MLLTYENYAHGISHTWHWWRRNTHWECAHLRHSSDCVITWLQSARRVLNEVRTAIHKSDRLNVILKVKGHSHMVHLVKGGHLVACYRMLKNGLCSEVIVLYIFDLRRSKIWNGSLLNVCLKPVFTFNSWFRLDNCFTIIKVSVITSRKVKSIKNTHMHFFSAKNQCILAFSSVVH